MDEQTDGQDSNPATSAPEASLSRAEMGRGSAIPPAREKTRIERTTERVVARDIAEHRLWEVNAPLVVAVSGGADSLCLLGILLALQTKGGEVPPGPLTVAHLDHGLRPESAEDAQFVARLAEQLGVPVIVERVDVEAIARREHRGIEDAARRARYAFLRRTASEVGARYIATGHTADDQVETILQHWLRGSGLAGLRGMRWRTGDVVRPLLALTHTQTGDYCAARGWTPREDASNRDHRFQRNRVRHELLPLLRSYNPAFDAQLLRNAALLAADDDALNALAETQWPLRAAVAWEDERPLQVDFALPGLRIVPAAVRYRLYRRAATLLGGDTASLEARHLLQVDDLALGTPGVRSVTLPGGLLARREYDLLSFLANTRTRAEAPAPGISQVDSETMLPVPGVADLPDLGWRVRAWVADELAGLPGFQAPPPPEHPPFMRTGSAADLGLAEMRVSLDADIAGDVLRVRPWRAGDRFQPFGMTYEKKVQDYFTDAKVPRALRRRLPLVFGRDHLLWVGGQRFDHRARVTGATRRVLTLQLEPLPTESPPTNNPDTK